MKDENLQKHKNPHFLSSQIKEYTSTSAFHNEFNGHDHFPGVGRKAGGANHGERSTTAIIASHGVLRRARDRDRGGISGDWQGGKGKAKQRRAAESQ